MKRAWTYAAIVAMAGTAVLAQQTAGSNDRVRLEAAINRELIDGDLAGAMQVYRALSESPERTVRAQALLRIGLGYKRTGDPQATRMLERALEFTDVPAVVRSARAALGSAPDTPGQAGSVKTLLVNGRDMNIDSPAVSPDGRLLAFTDYNSEANVVVRDLTTGVNKPVTKDGAAPGREAYQKAFSRDGRWLAYQLVYSDTSELRIIDLLAQGMPSPQVVLTHTNRWLTPYEWSADGKRIAAQLTGGRETAAQVGYLTLADKQFHVVRSIQWLGSTRLSISPDGAYLAYDNRADDTGERDVYVVSTDGKTEAAIARHPGEDTVVGWSGDGRHLIFRSEKGGTNDLYAQAMRNGRPSGGAVLLHRDVAGIPAGVTVAGDVVFRVNPSTQALYVADFDRTSGKVTLGTSKPIRGLRPDWIPGAGAVAHAVERSRAVLAVTTLATGKTREMTLSELQYMQGFSVAPDGRSVIARGAGIQSGQGLWVIDLGSGVVKPVALTPGQPKPELWLMPTWWQGTSSVAYLRVRTNSVGLAPGIRQAGPDEPKYLERNLATGEVRELFSFSTDPWGVFEVALSPDRRFLMSHSPQGTFAGQSGGGPYATDKNSYLYLHTLASRESRRLWQLPFPQAFVGEPQWLPDSSAAVVMRYADSDRTRLEVWMVPVDGATPRRIDIGIQNLIPGGMRISPDGRQMLLSVGDRRDGEIRAIERIVPGSKR